jgi:hypothetical protein
VTPDVVQIPFDFSRIPVIESRRAKILVALTILFAGGILFLFVFWSGAPQAPDAPVSLHDDSLREFHFTINGLDPLEQNLVLSSGERFLIDTAYTREPADGWAADQIELVLVYDNGSKTGKIETQSVIAADLNLEERRTRDGLIEWRCKRPKRPPDIAGLPRSLTARAGTYEMRLCWKREPKTAAELAAQHEDPLRFLDPFYRTEVRITPRVPRNQQ